MLVPVLRVQDGRSDVDADIATIVGFVLLGLVVGLLARLLVPSIAQRVR